MSWRLFRIDSHRAFTHFATTTTMAAYVIGVFFLGVLLVAARERVSTSTDRCLTGSVEEGAGSGDSDKPSASKRCLACHDGSLASDVIPKLGSAHADESRASTMGVAGGEHPTEVDYLQAYLHNPRRLRHPDAIDSRVRLPDGKVQCVSCHTDSPEDAANIAPLVMSNKGSALCLACHDV